MNAAVDARFVVPGLAPVGTGALTVAGRGVERESTRDSRAPAGPVRDIPLAGDSTGAQSYPGSQAELTDLLADPEGVVAARPSLRHGEAQRQAAGKNQVPPPVVAPSTNQPTHCEDKCAALLDGDTRR